MTKKIRNHVFVSGWVQGVFFRASIREKAKQLEITGWVKNLADGRVEAVLEGEKEAIEKMVKWLKVGPPLARVDRVEIEHQPFQNHFQNFKIKR